MRIHGLLPRDFDEIFKGIDLDNNQFLTVNELAYYLDGAQRSREEKIRDLPQDVSIKIDYDLRQLFDKIDTDKNGHLDVPEIMRAMAGLGVSMTRTAVQEMIQPHDKNGDGAIDFTEFKALMEPKILDSIINQDD